MDTQKDIPDSVLVFGASRGIGAAAAKLFLQHGYAVAGTHRGSGVPEGVYPVLADVTKEDEIQRAVSEAVAEHGPIDILVVSSGITDDGLLMGTAAERIRNVWETNTLGPMLATKAILRPMLRQKSGSIVLVSSAAARAGAKGQATYTASKSALDGFVRSMTKELTSRGLRFNVVAPGATNTAMTDALNDQQRQAMLDEIPMGRFAEPEEIAQVIFWVSQSTYTSGQTITVAGGAGLGA